MRAYIAPTPKPFAMKADLTAQGAFDIAKCYKYRFASLTAT